MDPGTVRALMSSLTVETIVTFLAALAFIGLYTTVARWWKHPVGFSMIALDFSISLTLLPSVIHHTLGVTQALDPAFAWFSVVALGLVPCVIVWRGWILIRLQVQGRRARRAAADKSAPEADAFEAAGPEREA